MKIVIECDGRMFGNKKKNKAHRKEKINKLVLDIDV